MGVNLWQLNLGKKFLDLTPKVQSIEGKWGKWYKQDDSIGTSSTCLLQEISIWTISMHKNAFTRGRNYST